VKINNNIDIIGDSGEEVTIFTLIKKHLDSVDTLQEFEEFRRVATETLDGCIGYMECMRFTDKSLLFRPAKNK
jgi:hypothetical protein